MSIPFRKSILTQAVALGLLAGGAAVAAEPMSQQLNEARQESQIWTTYALNPDLRANALKVTVEGGKATLSGTVSEGVSKALAEQIALGVSGIRSVDNQIAVQADYLTPPRTTERSYGEVIDDATISSAVKSKLMWSRYTNGLSTEVETRLGKVTLRGPAESAASKELASRLAFNTRGVLAVDNQMVVAATDPSVAAEAGVEVADSWITTKVKSTFLYSRDVDGDDISVSTRSGVVTLSGKVHSGSERNLAIELARNIRGVKSVSSKGLTLI